MSLETCTLWKAALDGALEKLTAKYGALMLQEVLTDPDRLVLADANGRTFTMDVWQIHALDALSSFEKYIAFMTYHINDIHRESDDPRSVVAFDFSDELQALGVRHKELFVRIIEKIQESDDSGNPMINHLLAARGMTLRLMPAE